MDTDGMAEWENDKEHVIYRIDQLDQKFDKLEADFNAHNEKLCGMINGQNEQIHSLRSETSRQINSLKLEVLNIVSENKIDIGLFKKEFQIKTSAWAFLGTAIAIAITIIGILIRNQFV
jgi:hypothetical protein